MATHITLTDLAGILRFVIPVVPTTDVTTEHENTDFRTTRRYLRIFGTQKNKVVEWSSFFPVNKNYDFVENGAEANGWEYVVFLQRCQADNLPIRIVITNENRRPILNMLATIDKFGFREDATNDIQYSISLTEFTVN